MMGSLQGQGLLCSSLAWRLGPGQGMDWRSEVQSLFLSEWETPRQKMWQIVASAAALSHEAYWPSLEA